MANVDVPTILHPSLNPKPMSNLMPASTIVIRFSEAAHYDIIKQTGILPVYEFQSYATTIDFLLSTAIINPNYLEDRAMIAATLGIPTYRTEYFIAFYRKGLDQIPDIKVIEKGYPNEIKWQFFKVTGFNDGLDVEHTVIAPYLIDGGRTSDYLSVSYLQNLKQIKRGGQP
ncbi:MAG: hypothetical protein H7Y11_08650 [Armatimonadetes bacterium]|nr:hypothetical protein [Anaerolineae bacterium]